jgi:peptide/nickel transport system permease protein
MLTYIIRRIILMIPTVFLISVIAFVVIQAPPGDFLTSQIEQLEQQYGSAVQDEIATLRQRYRLDRPFYEQYFHWITGIIFRLDFGHSFLQARSVTEIMGERLPGTVAITLLSLVFTWIVGIPIGLYSAVKQHTAFDYVFTFVAFIGRSIPNFLLALVLMFIFYSSFGWSLGGLFSQEMQMAPWSFAKVLDLLKHLILPVIVVGTAGTAGIVRVLRSMMLDELGKQYIQTARAKGLHENLVIWKHAFKVAVLPIISTIGWILPRLVSGALITSIVLNLPTTGAAMYTALLNQDMYVAGGFVFILSTLTVIGTLVSDILLAQIDPRIRYT